MKKIKYFCYVLLLIPALAFSQQRIDIGIFESSINGEVEVKVQPNFDINNNFLTNIQFTVRWDSLASVNITPVSVPPYLIDPQGASVDNNGFKYQIFASSPNCNLTWNAGQEYVVLKFNYSGCADFELIKDGWTQANNGDFYVELLGIDHTGIFYNNIANIVPDVELGKDTSICVYNNIELDAGNPGASYLWSDGKTTQKINIDASALGVGAYNYGVTVTAPNGCSASDWRLIIVDPCTGLNDVEPSEIEVYPNPTYGGIFIDTSWRRDDLRINVFDICGMEIIRPISDANNKHILDLSSLTPGIYFLQFSYSDLCYSKRIVLMN